MRVFSIFQEFLALLREDKMLWLLPMVACLAVLGGLISLGTSTAAGPFIYSLF